MPDAIKYRRKNIRQRVRGLELKVSKHFLGDAQCHVLLGFELRFRRADFLRENQLGLPSCKHQFETQDSNAENQTILSHVPPDSNVAVVLVGRDGLVQQALDILTRTNVEDRSTEKFFAGETVAVDGGLIDDQE